MRALLAELSAAGQASVLEQVSEPERDKLVGILKRDLDPEALTELDEEVLEDVLDQLDSKDIAAAARELETDDAADHPRRPAGGRAARGPGRAAGRRARRDRERAGLSGGHRRAPDAALAGQGARRAGRVGQVIDYCREATDLPDDVYDLFVVDRAGRLRGSVPLGRMLRSKRPVPILDIVDPDIPSVPATADQERGRPPVPRPEPGVLPGGRRRRPAARRDHGRRRGRRDRRGGRGGPAEDGRRRRRRHARQHRATPRGCAAFWLVVNLLTAVIASRVIGQFDGTIEKIVALAVLMPIVASMGGNAGTQTMTVAVRALAMGELTAGQCAALRRQGDRVGGLNGMHLRPDHGRRRGAWYRRLAARRGDRRRDGLQSARRGAGRHPDPARPAEFGVDPAVSSTVFLTTVTDVIGFLAFLGLATFLL